MGSKIEGICHKNEDCNSPNISEFDSFENLTLNSETSHQRKNLSEKDTMKEFPTSTADLDSTFAEGNTEVNCEKELPKSASLMSQIRNEKTDHPILKWNEQKNLLKMRKTNVRNALELASSSLKSNLKVKKLKKHRTSLKKLKKNDPKLTFIKERLYQLQEQTTSPVWVQCDSCTKWRCLKNVEDPAMLPKNWTCSLNSDTEYSSCIIPEESYDEKEHDDTFVFNKYTLGSVVWVTSFGPGWWPAMVDDDPDTETFFWLPKSSNVPNFYHVTFFGPEVSRAWVRSNCVVPFVPGKERVSKATKKVHQALKIAVAEAKLSLTLPLNDRRRIYCFATRYKGSWFMNTPSQDFREMSN